MATKPRTRTAVPTAPQIDIDFSGEHIGEAIGEPRVAVPGNLLVETEGPPALPIEPAPPKQEEKPKPVLPTATPGTVSADGYVPKGSAQRVECPIIPGLYVWFNVALAYAIRRGDYQGPGETPVERACRKMCFIVDHFEGWQIPHPLISGEFIACPSRDDWESFKPICSAFGFVTELGSWIMNEGLNKALDQALGN